MHEYEIVNEAILSKPISVIADSFSVEDGTVSFWDDHDEESTLPVLIAAFIIAPMTLVRKIK